MVNMKPCQVLISTGSCIDGTCTFNHDVHTCEPCGVVATSTAWFNTHLAGKRHRKVISGRRGFGSPEGRFCASCEFYVPHSQWEFHQQGVRHLQKQRYLAFQAVLGEASKDKHGVLVSSEQGLELGIAEIGAISTGTISITTPLPNSRIALVEVKCSSSVSDAFTIVTPHLPQSLRSSQQITISISFTSAFRGRFQDRIEFVFEDQSLSQRFVIVRAIRAISGDREDHEQFQPRAPFVPRQRTMRAPETEIVPGVRAPSLAVIPWIVPLPDATIPRNLSDAVTSGSTREIVERLRTSFLPISLNNETYGRHFKTLLWAEEHRMDYVSHLQIYDMNDATLVAHLPYYYLEVPGLAEKRPSVLVGDRILVQRHGESQGRWFEGGVHVLHQYEVGLRFNSSFQGHTPSQRYNVRFKLNRYPIRRQHQALDTALIEERLLFPAEEHIVGVTRASTSSPNFRLYNRLVGTNRPQLQAVASILKQKAGSVPFAVFGPPGTGKTVTIVEAMLQILRTSRTVRILACAPSNSAADLIALRLADELSTDELFRMYAPSRFKNQVPDQPLDYTYTTRGLFSVPLMARMKQFRVVVTTCVSASVPYGIGMPRGHFSHIFVDEAGQATEPEVMIAVKTMADRSTNLVLSGDPKQLGPIIRSSVARKLGLEMSCLERLMECDIYNETTGYGITVVKLIKNFRSHNAILKFPNERFYNNDLQECGTPATIDKYLNWAHLPRARFPIIFHALHGKDDREASSPSFFNIDEVSEVREYVKKLRLERDRTMRITDHDIGIITPYNAQVKKIRAGLVRDGAEQVKVGTVEEFQGQERTVIIVSTVRSSREFVEYDLQHTLGFVANPRRFNVAVTRAQALLIVIGDPDVLGLDPLWRAFLNYVHRRGGWAGPPISWNPADEVSENGRYDADVRELGLADMNEFTRRMEQMTLGGAAAALEDNEAEANVDRPWRDIE